VDNIQEWQFPDHSFYFHDDDAVDRLLQKHWPSFPHIPVASKCMRSGAAVADLWRLLVLWEYGGIYTDLDNAPGKFWNDTTIQPDDDAFFVVEHIGVLSQYFMAASPKHPLLYLAIQSVLHRLLEVEHVGKQYIPKVTGPGALKKAFKYFMRTVDTDEHEHVTKGKYVGVGNRSVTVAGSKVASWQIVIRGSMTGNDKIGGYHQMDMRHFSKMAKKKFNESCLVHLYNLEYPIVEPNLTNW
jgi:mannosyltransferase OCH1-like enzyme